MNIITDINSIPPIPSPCGLTIGTFDGVHLGHLALFQALRHSISPQGTLAVLTFSNHPSDAFTQHPPIPLLITLEHKLKLLEEAGVDLAIVIPFTAAFAAYSFSDFLTYLKKKLNFTHLTLGTGASFGKNRQGDETHIRALAQTLKFTPEYLPKVLINDLPVSSGRIRNHLIKGELQLVKTLLGRPYSIYALIQSGGKSLTLNVQGLCLPPNGRYPIHLKRKGQYIQGVVLIDQQTTHLQLELSEATQTLITQETTSLFAEVSFST